ncbi:hypothetical protein D9758_013797 [Tetrapyrgos nigripes]|uniref:Cytochrome P450 n=1 Tax=Tetrapyrgos nigripes TaxID=182062 RepID=A0A8H5D6F4_9AGAR|nr:hypothetical protein D9758_013797 [Tetrapyrgos nigripes]
MTMYPYLYPPGPKGFPYLGLPNAKIPTKKFWLTHIEWGKKHGAALGFTAIIIITFLLSLSLSGDLIHFSRFSKHYVVINTLETARDILDKQARVTSDRPHTRVDEIVSNLLDGLSQIPYSKQWRKTRKLFHQNLHAESTVQFHPIQTEQVWLFVKGVVLSESTLKGQIATLSQNIMFLSIYGLDISSNEEEMPTRNREAIDTFENSIIPGWDGYKYIPFIHLLPSWFPWGGRLIATIHALGEIAREGASKPWDAVREKIKSDGNHASLIGKLLSRTDPDNDEEIDRIKWFGFQFMADTMSAISTFFLAMSLYPDVQSKGQEELDAVLGKEGIPTFDDCPSLPYIEAIFREVMRWHPALPMGVPHNCIEDIVYDGYYIPKGTTIYANIWAMTHDTSVYEDADRFIPERHLRKDRHFDNINSILAYRFERRNFRVCVGRYMANDTIWLAIPSTLAAVDISTLPNENVEDYFSDGAFCSPHTLDCSVTPQV